MLGVALVVALVVLGVEAYRGVRIAQQADAGRTELVAAQSLLEKRRLDATPAELDTSDAQFASALRKFRAVRASVAHDPLLWTLGHLPFIGGQVHATIDLAAIGEQAAHIGTEGVRAVREFDAVRAEGTGTLPEKSLAILQRTDPTINAIELRLAAVDQERRRIGNTALLPPLRAAVREFDQRRARVDDLVATYRRARALTPGFLGFNGPRTYLILAQNNAELLPTGGLVSVIGTMRVDHGHIESLTFQDAVQFGQDWMARTHTYVAPPAPLRQYLLKDMSWNLTVSNWSPDFPTSAREAERFYQMGGGTAVDGVIGIDVNTLARLLEVTGPIDVPEFNVTVNSTNALDVTEEHTRAPYEPKADRKEFVALLAHAVLDRVLRPTRGMWSPLIDAVQQLGTRKDLLIYSSDPGEEQVIRQFGWDGSVTRPPGDYLMLVDASVNSTKLNAAMEQSATVDVRLNPAGGATTTVAVDYFNNLSAWAKGKDPGLVSKLMLGGVYGDFLRLLTPPGSSILSVRDGQGEIGAGEIGKDLGLSEFGRFFTVPANTRQSITFRYLTPPTVETDGRTWIYRLLIQKQPGQQAMPVRVTVSPPAGMKIVGSAVNGKDAAGAPGELSFRLDRDRTVEVMLEPG